MLGFPLTTTSEYPSSAAFYHECEFSFTVTWLALQRRCSSKERRGRSRHKQTCMQPSCAASCSCSESSMLSGHSCCRGACARSCACPSVPVCPAAGTAPLQACTCTHQFHFPIVHFNLMLQAHRSDNFQGMLLLALLNPLHMQTLVVPACRAPDL